MRTRRLLPLLLLSFALLLAACGEDREATGGGATAGASWTDVAAQARGQTVSWWMYGGDDRVNAYVREHVEPAARKLGVTLRQVPVSDTADAVAQVVAQRRAGRSEGGDVDLIWINGENFASGKEAGLWLEDWARDLPNARLVDWDDPTIASDFQVAVDGQESPWSRAAFVFAADRDRVGRPPRDLDALLDWARRNPGRFTYPAPPDFTGSAFVRQVVQAKGEDAAFDYLAALQPHMFRAGEWFPKSEAQLNALFGDGKVDFAMSYDASFVLSGVRKGQFPKSTRPFLLEGGSLTNVSYVTVPDGAANEAGALVVANLLLDPRLQAVKADPDVLGHPSVLDLGRLESGERRRFEGLRDSPYLLDDLGMPLPELAAGRVAPLEERWKREILR